MKSLFSSVVDKMLAEQIQPICDQLKGLPVQDRIDALNRIKQALHAVSPMAAEPVDCVLWVCEEAVDGNDYNPNKVAPPEMRLLTRSITADGLTQPVVTWAVSDNQYEVVDGCHRYRVCTENKGIRHRLYGRIPVTVLRGDDRNGRIAATIRHNRARGVHGVMPMTDIVSEMLRNGMSDDEVAKELGMDADELLRFKQNTGLPELFQNHEYSMSWE